jgi:hypothetical protein
MTIPKSKRFGLSVYVFHVDMVVFIIGLVKGAEPVALATAIATITIATLGIWLGAETLRKSE